MSKLKVGLLGSSGLVGQKYIELLKDHPYFELSYVPLREECVQVEKAKGCALIFSALPNECSEKIDPLYVERGFPVFSSASCHRMKEKTLLIIPEVNGEKLKQWKGEIIAKPNCTLQSMLLPLFPLHQQFRLKKVAAINLQSISGAGKNFSLGPNVIPYIEGEEEKSERESLKLLEDSAILFSVHCMRVPVMYGHMASISASFEKKPSLEEVKGCWDEFQKLDLPSAPEKLFIYREEKDRPQPEKDIEDGMAITLGRLRSCPLFDIRFTALSHNLVRGAAGGGLLTAEYFAKENLL
jgi:aspartate-semialdehyde dehydrogenase